VLGEDLKVEAKPLLKLRMRKEGLRVEMKVEAKPLMESQLRVTFESRGEASSRSVKSERRA
jgi:hypothetical protein